MVVRACEPVLFVYPRVSTLVCELYSSVITITNTKLNLLLLVCSKECACTLSVSNLVQSIEAPSLAQLLDSGAVLEI